MTSHISEMTTQNVALWLEGLSLSRNYGNVVIEQAMDGPALAQLAIIVDKSSSMSGSDPAAGVIDVVRLVFGLDTPMGDILKIMDGLVELLYSESSGARV